MKRSAGIRLAAILSLFCLLIVSISASAETIQEENVMTEYDFTVFTNVKITGIEIASLSKEELGVLYQAARYCQAMTEADIDTMREIVSKDMTFTHMSGMRQTREEYFADVANGSLTYYTIGMADPVIEIDGDRATVTYTAILNANAYGTRGTFRMKGSHHYENRDGVWIAVNK